MKHNINANISPIISNNVNYHVKLNEALFCLLFIEENKVHITSLVQLRSVSGNTIPEQ